MISSISNYNFPDHVRGDTFDGVQFTVTVNSLPIDLTLAIINMDLRSKLTNEVAKSFTTVNSGGLTIILPPENGQFTFDSQIIDVPAGTYAYDIEIVFSNGVVKTYIGGIWNILQDITYTTETN